ncbi:Gfo/Idh/MocA family oxidoreductase [candidate division KSB1 bacterium]|nr:Gfo/Idh/MocA family oxidoreductase [candidate division KSB1 bacterium]
MQKINLCFLGCGAITRLHSRVARSYKSQVNLLYASRSLEKAREFQKRFGGKAAFGSYEAACRSPQVDAVFICTPHALHLEHVQLAVAHQKHVLVEKPLARTLVEVDQIATAVRQAGVMCMVAENFYFKPMVKALKEYLQKGYIGAPLFIEVNRANLQKNAGWRADAEMMGGGALLEGGVHWINLISQLGGPVQEVLAVQPQTRRPLNAPFEDSLEVVLKFESGAAGKLLHTWNVPARWRGLQLSKIYGDEGIITFESNGLMILLAGRKARLCFPQLTDFPGYKTMLGEFLKCLRENRAPAMSIAVARRDLQVVFAAYRSLETARFEKPEMMEANSDFTRCSSSGLDAERNGSRKPILSPESLAYV